jgi:hypothetical protein
MARDMTGNEKAANGPLPGDHTLVEEEFRGSAGIASPGYYPSLNGAELADAQRSGCFPYASFTGAYGPNVVYAWRSEDEYQGTTFLCDRQPGELFLVGGTLPGSTARSHPGRMSPVSTRRRGSRSGAPTSRMRTPRERGSRRRTSTSSRAERS